MSARWTGEADRVYPPKENDRCRLVGECENGHWWVQRGDRWWVRFSRWNPLHWAWWWNSRRRNQVVFLEWVTGAGE